MIHLHFLSPSPYRLKEIKENGNYIYSLNFLHVISWSQSERFFIPHYYIHHYIRASLRFWKFSAIENKCLFRSNPNCALKEKFLVRHMECIIDSLCCQLCPPVTAHFERTRSSFSPHFLSNL